MKETDWDRLTVHIKKEVVEELKNSYAAFGWNLVQEQEHPQYSDTKVLYFTRPHFLMHKDALQFLQASFEIAFNQTGKLEDKKKGTVDDCGYNRGIVGCVFDRHRHLADFIKGMGSCYWFCFGFDRLDRCDRYRFLHFKNVSAGL